MGDEKAEIRALLAEAQQQDFMVKQTNGGHIHVQRDGHLVALVSSSPSAQGAAKAVRADLVKAGFQTEGERVRNEVVDDGGDEGRLLLSLSESDHARSTYTLSHECGMPIGTVNFILRGALSRFPNLHYENELWSWDPTERTGLAQSSTEDLALVGANAGAPDVNVTSGDGGANATGAKSEESTRMWMGLTAGWSLVGSYVVDPKAHLRGADEAEVFSRPVEPAGGKFRNSPRPGDGGSNANLNGVTLRDDNLPYRDGTVAREDSNYLTVAKEGGANLTGANLTGASLTGANLTGANLTGANLTGADLKDANLAWANLGGHSWGPWP